MLRIVLYPYQNTFEYASTGLYRAGKQVQRGKSRDMIDLTALRT